MYIVVIGRNGMVYSITHQLKKDEIDQNKLNFDFTATSAMVPTAHVIVYYIQKLGEIVYDQIKIDVIAPQSNKVSFF